jgi:transcriptional regulator with XRE-family HTH domain
MASIKVKRCREKSRDDYRQPLENGPSVRFVDREEQERVGARVRAARSMAGIEKRKDLTDRVNLPRFSAALLGQIERGERALYEHEADALAHVLPVDADFFYEAPVGATQLDRIEALLERIAERLDLTAPAVDGVPSPVPVPVADRPTAADRGRAPRTGRNAG